MKIEFRLLWQINCPLRCASAGNKTRSWDLGAWELQGTGFVWQGAGGTAPKDAQPICICVRAGCRANSESPG